MVDGLVQNPHGRVCHASHVRVDAGDRDGRTGADGDVVVLPHYGYVVGNGSSEFEARLEEVLCPDVVHAEDGGARRKGGDPRLQAREQPGEMVFPELDLRNLVSDLYLADFDLQSKIVGWYAPIFAVDPAAGSFEKEFAAETERIDFFRHVKATKVNLGEGAYPFCISTCTTKKGDKLLNVHRGIIAAENKGGCRHVFPTTKEP